MRGPAADRATFGRDEFGQEAAFEEVAIVEKEAGARGLVPVVAAGPLSYREPHEARDFMGLAAAAKALNHANFATAMLGAGLLLLILPLAAVARLRAGSIMLRERRRA